MTCAICHKPIKKKESHVFTLRPSACLPWHHRIKYVRWHKACEEVNPVVADKLCKAADEIMAIQIDRERAYWDGYRKEHNSA